MKTTNFVRIAFRILMQSLIPVLVMETLVFIIFGILNPRPAIVPYVSALDNGFNLKVDAVLFSSIFLFGVWFHFISSNRFKNRRPNGLYREYITWFMETQ
jgi:hypothetical protein